MPKKTKEQPARPRETRAEREARIMRELVRRSDQLYREYWLTLSEQDRARVPAP